MLNINRHNYEEVFLLYVDGELSPAERAAVENFVQQNPDLQEELKMLQQAVLPLDDITFDAKELLLKVEDGITVSNYEEYFLLAVDNELNQNEQASVEKFVLQHPELQDEYTLLQSTKLPAEVIAFEHKHELYRSEKERRVIPFTWLRMGAAAAVFIVIAGLWITKQRSIAPGETQPAVADVNIGKQGTSSSIQKIETPQKPDEEATTSIAKSQQQSEGAKKVLPSVTSSVMAATAANRVKKQPVNTPTNDKPKLLRPTPEMLAALIQPSTQKENAPVEVNVKNNSATINSSLASTAGKAVVDNDGSEVHHAVYKEMNDDESDHVILIGSAEINTNKIKSILGRASSLFKRRNNKEDGDDKAINIASFQIKK